MGQLRNFLRNTSGNLAITAAVGGAMLTIAVGAAIDGARLVNNDNQIQALADAAALGAAHPDEMKPATRKALAQKIVRESLDNTDRNFDVDTPNVTVNDLLGTVEVDLRADVPMYFGKLLGEPTRQVRGNAVAQNRSHNHTAQGGVAQMLSISFVIDGSSSMDEMFNNEKRLSAIKNAMNDVFGQYRRSTGAMPIEAAIYPFAWGNINARTETLQLGMKAVLDSLNGLTSDKGGMPAKSIEMAVEEQANGSTEFSILPKKRVVVFLTDGSVEADKADARGRMLPSNQFYPPAIGGRCREISEDFKFNQAALADELLKVQEEHPFAIPLPDGTPFTNTAQLEYDVADPAGVTRDKHQALEQMSMSALINGAANPNPPGGGGGGGTGASGGAGPLAATTAPPRGLESGSIDTTGWSMHLGHLVGDRVGYMAEYDKWRETCRPVQVDRVVRACDLAQEKKIDVMTINISGEAGPAADITASCIFDNPDTEANESEDAMPVPTVIPGQGDAPDSMVYKSDNGSSYAIVNDEAALRDVLKSLLPNSDPKKTSVAENRKVRLVR